MFGRLASYSLKFTFRSGAIGRTDFLERAQ
jgi:hypothetical protein